MKKLMAILMILLFSIPVLVDNVSCLDGSKVEGEGSQWRFYRGNQRRTGTSIVNTTHVDGSKSWSFDTGGVPVSSPVLDEEGTIYLSISYQWEKRLIAITTEGEEKWVYDITGQDLSTPAVSKDGNVYVGATGHDHQWFILPNYLHSVGSDGISEWRFEAAGGIQLSPIAGDDGIVYFGSVDGNLYAVNSYGEKEWKFETGDSIFSSPAISDEEQIVFGSNDGNLYSLNQDGTKRWSYKTSGEILSTPAIDEEGNIYVGSNDQKLYVLDPKGNLKWDFFFNGPVNTSPSIDRYVYVSVRDHIYALSKEGDLKWTFKTAEIANSPSVGRDETIFVGTLEGTLHAIDNNGNEKWRFKADFDLIAEPVISDNGRIYISSADGYLYALNGPPTPPVELKTFSDDGKVELMWSPPNAGYATLDHYRIYRDNEMIAQTNVTNFTDMDVENEVTYSYSVSAVNDIGEGDMSIEKTATPKRISFSRLWLVSLVFILFVLSFILFLIMREHSK